MNAPAYNSPQWHRQLDLVNRSPLNKQAKRLLEEAGAETYAGNLYSLQLLIWGLTKHPEEIADPASRYANDLADAAEMMRTDPPSKVQKLYNPPEQLPEDPVKAASLLAESFYLTMKEVHPYFRRANPN